MSVSPAGGRGVSDRLLIALPSFLFFLGALFLPVFRLRANRLQAGVPIWLFDLNILDSMPAVTLLFPAAAVLPFFSGGISGLERIIRSPEMRDPRAAKTAWPAWMKTFLPAAFALMLFSALLLVTNIQALELRNPDVARSRLSPESGFWCITGICAYLFFLSGDSFSAKPGRSFGRWALFISLVLGTVAWSTGFLSGFSLYEEWRTIRERYFLELLTHLSLSFWPLLPAAAAAFPLGIAAARNIGLERKVFAVSSAFQIVPSLAVFGLLMPILSAAGRTFPVLREWGISGLGFAPVFIALTLYSFLPLLRGVFLGIRSVKPHQLEAARGMGMTDFQILRKIELPLALPSTLDGIRLALVQAIGLATLGALIGAGGLGWFVFQGLGQGADDLILLSSLSICMLAIVADGVMRRLRSMFVRTGTGGLP